jgi:hypothetical protein
MGLLYFYSTNENTFFAVHLKHSSFWSLPAVKPMQNNVMHVVPCLCMFALSVYTLGSLCDMFSQNVLTTSF